MYYKQTNKKLIKLSLSGKNIFHRDFSSLVGIVNENAILL